VDAARADVFLKTAMGKEDRGGDAGGERSDVRADVPVPAAPFFGARVLRDIPLGEVLELLDRDELFRLQWGGRGSGPEYHAAVKNEFEPTLARLSAAALRDGWIAPQAVYGYFPVQSAGNDVVVYDPDAYATDAHTRREIARFHFPRQDGRERLCIADYFRSVESGEVDVVALQVVTVGDEATRRFETLQAAGEYAVAFYSHGLAVEAAEATAEWLHRRVQRELGFAAKRGKRYSWGYGACPDLEDHDVVFKLLPAADALGMELTTAHQLIPEQSTAAIIVHHPEAKYYAIRTAAVPAAEASV
jgi:5-methyltetrahydrofolate--homocysteine methyltransferase